MTATDVLLVIVITFVAVDIGMLHAEIRRHREYERRTRPKLDPFIVEIKCDNTDALAKIDQVTAAAERAADQVGRIGIKTQAEL